jgi:phosphatidylinositol alpha-mannosyltransferase
MKIGLVCPYIYPETGGVAVHVRYLYENLRLRGHDVRVITASHGPQRSSEGDIIRLGVGFSVPINASVGTLTFSPRYLTQIDDMLERERFDVLHLHEPFVPFLSLFLLRESRSVNIATFHAYAGFSPSYELGRRVMGGHASRIHGRIAVSAAARHFIDRYFPGDYKVIPNGVDIARFASAVPIARWQDGTPNVLFVGRHEPRKGLLDLLKAHRILRRTGVREPAPRRRVRAPGARGAPVCRRPRPQGCRVPRQGVGLGEGPALPDGRRLRLARDRR